MCKGIREAIVSKAKIILDILDNERKSDLLTFVLDAVFLFLLQLKIGTAVCL